MKTPRFTTEEEILEAIDRNRKRGNAAMKRAGEYEIAAKMMFQRAYVEKSELLRIEGNKFLDKSKATLKYATMLLGPRAKKLGERLSEFRTNTCFNFSGQKGVGDASVEGV